MAVIRLPVALKFDNTTDFYNEFVLDLKEQKTLQGFIVDLLKAYYDNEEFKVMADKLIGVYDPMEKIREQLNKVQLEHAKTIMSTDMLKQHIERNKERYERGDFYDMGSDSQEQGDGTSEQEQLKQLLLMGESQQPSSMVSNKSQERGTSSSLSSDDLVHLVRRLEVVESTLPDILSKLDILIGGNKEVSITQNNMNVSHHSKEQVNSTTSVDKSIHVQNSTEVEEDISKVESDKTIISEPIQTKNSLESHQKQVEPKIVDTLMTNNIPVTYKPEVEKDKPEEFKDIDIDKESTKPTSFNKALKSTGVMNSEDEETKPASFKKAFASIKKK